MEQWLDEPNRVYESSNVTDESKTIIDFLGKANLSDMYDFYIDCMNIDHVDFVIKSHYMFGQISTILDHIKVGNDKTEAFFAMNDGNILFECMFIKVGNEFEVYKITDKGFNIIENLFR